MGETVSFCSNAPAGPSGQKGLSVTDKPLNIQAEVAEQAGVSIGTVATCKSKIEMLIFSKNGEGFMDKDAVEFTVAYAVRKGIKNAESFDRNI